MFLIVEYYFDTAHRKLSKNSCIGPNTANYFLGVYIITKVKQNIPIDENKCPNAINPENRKSHFQVPQFELNLKSNEKAIILNIINKVIIVLSKI